MSEVDEINRLELLLNHFETNTSSTSMILVIKYNQSLLHNVPKSI